MRKLFIPAFVFLCAMGAHAQTKETPRAFEVVSYLSGKLRIEAYI
ncbi:MAG TPA: hypothetical protein VKD70_18710 [Candidatus Acidoferrum sp.]|nr:hypothetical protein [Candidatus Acidoferrum sp.]